MTADSTIKASNHLDFVLRNSFPNGFFSSLWRTVLASFLIGLIWLVGLSPNPALAASNNSAATSGKTGVQVTDLANKSDRLDALIACLPKRLSEPNLDRALDEMGNDQLERVFNRTNNPKLSKAETELKDCLVRNGFAD